MSRGEGGHRQTAVSRIQNNTEGTRPKNRLKIQGIRGGEGATVKRARVSNNGDWDQRIDKLAVVDLPGKLERR